MKEQREEQPIMSVCGTDCRSCYCFGNMCNGCSACEGKVFHAPEGKACPIYDCVRNEKELHDCGKCKEVPCQIWHLQEILSFLMKNLRKTLQGDCGH